MEKFVKNTILAAGNILLKSRKKNLKIEKKENAGYVTEADLECEKFIIESISNEFPGHSVLAEEGGEQLGHGEYKWIIDPLDGTTNFVHGLPCFCVSIACEYKDEIIIGAIYNPVTNELFFAEKGKGAYLNDEQITVSKKERVSDSLLATGFYYHKGEKLDTAIDKFRKLKQGSMAVRRMGSAAIDLAYTACGIFDGYWEKGISPWDVAAGLLIVKEAGGRVSNYTGRDSSVYDREILASNGLIHQEMVDLLNG